MAHQVETMAYAGEVPWHGLGVPVSNDLSPTQMMSKAGLDWKVEKKPLYYNGYTQQNVKISNKFALVRETDGKLLDVIGSDWEPVQNEEAFNFFSEYVLAGDMEMHTAGSLKGGEMVWALAKVKESFDLFGGDKVESYLLFSNPHSYGKSIDIRFTPIRVVCNNTLSLSLDMIAERSVRVGHRTQFDASEVKKALGIASNKLQTYKEMAEFLGSKKYNADTLIQYYNEVFPRSKDKRLMNLPLSLETLSKNAKACHGIARRVMSSSWQWYPKFRSNNEKYRSSEHTVSIEKLCFDRNPVVSVSYTHLTLPTNREV